MTDFNLEWLEQNFKGKHAVLFNVGCADLTDDSLRFQMCLPDATIFSFDCADCWKDQNFEKSKIYNLHYLHKAVSYENGKRKFVQGSWEYNGTLSTLQSLDKNINWNGEVEVDVISLNRFCESNPYPDILHIDAESNEYNILKDILYSFLPSVIWSENREYYNDEDYNSTIPYSRLHDLMISKNYNCYKFKNDSLFVNKEFECSEYIHKILDLKNWSPHEKIIQKRLWIMRYNLCKEESWPGITEVEEFFLLPQKIQDECVSHFYLEPDSRFFTKKG